MNDPHSFYLQHRNAGVIHEWNHYFETSERLLSGVHRKGASGAEIGALIGESLEMWRDCLGPIAPIFWSGIAAPRWAVSGGRSGRDDHS